MIETLPSPAGWSLLDEVPVSGCVAPPCPFLWRWGDGEPGSDCQRASAASSGDEAASGKRQEQAQCRNECEKSRLCSGWGITEGLKV